MRILQVIPIFCLPELFGGSQMVLYQISKALVKRGHDITVYTSDLKDLHVVVKEDIEGVEGIKIVRFKNVNRTFSRATRFVISPRMVEALDKEIQKFDIIHLHGARGFEHLVVHKYSRKRGVPYIVHAHGILGARANSVTEKVLRFAYDNLIGRKIIKDATRAIALNDIEAKQYANIGVHEDKIRIIPNGIDLSEFESLPVRGEFRKKYGLNGNQKIILNLGRLHKTKGLDLLAKAFAGLSRELDNVKLVIVGPDDGYLPMLKGLIKELKLEEKVVFTGPLYGEEKLEAYVDADVFVNPRADEPFGLVVLEACACGTPVICSEGCGIAGILDGQAGLVVPYDKDQLQRAILRILSDDKLREWFGERGKSLVREQFNWDKIVEQVETVYLSCLSSAP